MKYRTPPPYPTEFVGFVALAAYFRIKPWEASHLFGFYEDDGAERNNEAPHDVARRIRGFLWLQGIA